MKTDDWSTDDEEMDIDLGKFNDRIVFVFIIHKRLIYEVFVFVHSKRLSSKNHVENRIKNRKNTKIII